MKIWKIQVFEVTPIHCVVEISRSAGDLREYAEVFHVYLPLVDLYPGKAILIYLTLITSSVKASRVCLGTTLLGVHWNQRQRLIKRMSRSRL